MQPQLGWTKIAWEKKRAAQKNTYSHRWLCYYVRNKRAGRQLIIVLFCWLVVRTRNWQVLEFSEGFVWATPWPHWAWRCQSGYENSAEYLNQYDSAKYLAERWIWIFTTETPWHRARHFFKQFPKTAEHLTSATNATTTTHQKNVKRIEQVIQYCT